MIVFALLAVAAALLLWPSKPPSYPFLVRPTGPDYLESVRCLQVVAKRLANTQKLTEAERKALDAIVLALSAGSAE